VVPVVVTLLSLATGSFSLDLGQVDGALVSTDMLALVGEVGT